MRFATLLLISALCTFRTSGAFAAEDPLTQFEREVRPILEQRCFECHGAEKQKGGLRLDRKASVLGSGDSGQPIVVPGQSGSSLLIQRVLSNDPEEFMPPKGERLKPEQIASLKQWIDRGAHWPLNKELGAGPTAAVTSEAAKARVITEADRAFWSFQPPHHSAAPDDPWCRQPLDRLVLARLKRKGLAPSGEVSSMTFVRRLTFDITGLPPTPEEVEAFVSDTSPQAYEQLADRLLASPRFGERLASMWLPLARFAEDQAQQINDDTKFFYPNAHLYRAWVIEAFNRDLPYEHFLKLQLAADRLPDTPKTDLAALGFLGLGPKYYDRDRLDVMADEWEDRVDTVTRTMLGMTVACARCHDHKFDPITTGDYYALAGVFASTRLINRMPDGGTERGDAKAEKMNPATLHIVEDGNLQNLNVFIRGNVERKGPVTPHRFLTVLSSENAAPFRDGSGRAELAEAIASRDNPLTARVIVNRVWGLFFGRSLVSTPSNFGRSGAPPSDQALLDDLAARFVEQGWSIKTLVREIALSATYRQGSRNDPAKMALDPGNESLWRMNRRRLSVEQWRDAVLYVSGELRESLGARSENLDDPDGTLRTVYSRVSRMKLAELLMQFDYPDANVHAEKRSATTTPIQKLFLLNSAFMQRRAAALAMRLQQIEGTDDEHLTAIYRLLFARDPDATERTLGLAYLRSGHTSEMTAWERYAQLLLASNEMLYVD
jgi:hypothetical protein